MPLAVFCTYKNVRGSKVVKDMEYIDDLSITKVLRDSATAVYGITDPVDLKKFTSHSIRVGACVLLHASDYDHDYIKFRLRWQSDTYRVYLRNVASLAKRYLKELRTRINGD